MNSMVFSQEVQISFWYPLGGNSGRVFENLVNEFNNTHEEIYVEAIFTGGYGETVQKVMANLAGGDLPEGGLLPAAPLWTGRNDNYLVEKYLNSPEGLDKDDFYSVLWDYNKYDGRICSLPFNNSTPVMFYNKDLMKEIGLGTEPPETWDELKEMATKVKNYAKETGRKGRLWPINMRNEDWMMKAFILQNNGKLMNEDNTQSLVNKPKAVEAISFWSKLIEEDLMPKATHNRARDQFISGNLVFLYDTTGGVGSVANSVDFDFGTAALPGKEKRAVTVGGAGLAMFKSTEEKEKATWTFLKWLLSTENCIEFSKSTGYIPIRKSALNSEEIQNLFKNEPYYQAGFEQLKYAVSYEHFWEMGTFDDYMKDLISNVEQGAKSPQEAADKFVDQMEKEIERNN